MFVSRILNSRDFVNGYHNAEPEKNQLGYEFAYLYVASVLKFNAESHVFELMAGHSIIKTGV